MSVTVICPVKDGSITGDDCIIICDVADGMLKPSCLPDGVMWDEKQQQKCKRCKYHTDVTE